MPEKRNRRSIDGSSCLPGDSTSAKLRLYYLTRQKSPNPLIERFRSWYAKEGGRPSAYKSPESGEYKLYTSLRDMLDPKVIENFKSSITMVVVDSPAVDFKFLESSGKACA
jgi:hypothetical protein